MEHMESGIAMIALRSGARLLPAYIAGRPGLFRRTHVYYGEPFSVKDIAARGINREACREVLERIQEVYLALEQEAVSYTHLDVYKRQVLSHSQAE